MDWFDGMYEAPKGVLKVKGKKVGGHALLVRGVNVTRRTAIIRNSWGMEWGRMGDAEMGWDELGWLLRQPYADACIPISRLMPKPA